MMRVRWCAQDDEGVSVTIGDGGSEGVYEVMGCGYVR